MIHIFDDEKFVDGAIRLLNAAKIFNHKYIILTKNASNLTYVTSSEVIVIKHDKRDFKTTLKNIIKSNEIKVIAVHALNQPKYDFINYLSNNYLIIWFVFGYDIYDQWKPFQRNIYEKETKAYLNKGKSYKLLFFESIIRIPLVYKMVSKISFQKLKKSKSGFAKAIKSNHPRGFYEAIKKIEFVAPVLREEMKFINEINSKLKYLPFSYGHIEDYIEGIGCVDDEHGVNILVGNSATPSNNHLEIFLKLKKVNLGDRKVIVPLNYGDKIYRNFILKKGREILGAHFFPILDFMPLNEYNKILKTCNIAIFNHIRQQALANIIVILYKGAKVFINKNSPVFEEFLHADLLIYDSKNLSFEILNKPLNNIQGMHNQSIILEIYGKKMVEGKVRRLLLIVEEELYTLKYTKKTFGI